ncbi:MAG: FliM/FliN family flagellar motor switch protein, partial [candidate division Zixibacteria bacterium]|nr:FliM/FliN family flagellar motor switch protein [candidate division Zixibacteria bacterium]
AQNWIDATKKKSHEADRSLNENNLQSVSAVVTANLLDTTIKMKDFLKLRVGDIVPSEKKIVQPMEISINQRKKFFAKPGLSGKKKAFQVVEAIEGIVEEI